jgi:hypothetical protein
MVWTGEDGSGAVSPGMVRMERIGGDRSWSVMALVWADPVRLGWEGTGITPPP